MPDLLSNFDNCCIGSIIQARAEVFAALADVRNNELFETADKVKWLILEKLLDSAVTYVKETTRSAAVDENCIWLMRLVYHFIYEGTDDMTSAWKPGISVDVCTHFQINIFK